MKQITKYAFLPVVFLIFKTSLIYAQKIEFNRIIPEDGTNFGYVYDIVQDKDGFMWFATMTGVYKYDGNQLTDFKNDSTNSNSFSANSSKTIYADSNGILWFGTQKNGLDRYDPSTGIFTHFRHDPNDSTSIAGDGIFDILRDHKGQLWIATNQGLDQFDPETNGFIHFKSVKDDVTTLSDLRVRCLYEDKQGTLWVGTGNRWLSNDYSEPEYGGLNRYNRETGTFTQYRSKANDPHSLKSNKVTSIFEDNNGILWIGTHENGLHQMDRETGTFKQMTYDPKHPEIFGNPEFSGRITESINFITQDTKGGFWIGKHRTGLFYYNPEEGEMVNINEDGTGNGTFESATCVFTSRDGILWIGGRNGSLYRINVWQQSIPKLFVLEEKVGALYEEQDGTLWIGKRNDLLRVDKNKEDTLRFNTELKFIKDSDNVIYDIRKDLQGTLWVGTNTGLFKWDPANQKFTGYHHDPANENSLSDNRVYTIFEDSRHNFWVINYRGLNRMNRNTGVFTHLSEFRDNYVRSITEDKSGYLWIGGWFGGAGLARFNPNSETFKTYKNTSGIHSIFIDSDSVVWVGGQGGLYFFNSDMDEFIRFGNSYALSGLSDVIGMVEDNLKNLWIVTSDAIVRLNQERNQTSVFGKNYGVERGSLFYGTPLKGKNGDIYFGHETGYFQINPIDFPKNADTSEILFTQLLLFDQEIQTSKDGPLKQPLQTTKSIKLPFNQNVFSFDFTLIDYINPEETRMLYYLENYDKDWIPAYSKRRASYFNVPPGHYVLHVKGTGSNGVWVEKKIEVTILPPWYRTWLAYIFYALVFMVGVFAFDRFMRRRIVQRERQKTQERELAQAKEIEKAYTQLKSTQAQLIQSEKMASLGELTAGIAHEIQNPLNFVNNFSEVNAEMIDEMHEELKAGKIEEAIAISNDIKENEQKINYHGKRADAIVKGMLQHSRTSSGVKEPTDINALCDEYLRLSYHGFRAKDKSFNADFKLEADENLPKINVIPQDIGRVLLNLINNAFYAVDKRAKENEANYKPQVVVSTSSSPFEEGGIKGGLNGKVTITVSDNGLGINKNIIDKIFQPFFTTKPTGQGTGLGLSLSYDIVKAHGGEIKVESEVGAATKFIIQIPIKTNSL